MAPPQPLRYAPYSLSHRRHPRISTMLFPSAYDAEAAIASADLSQVDTQTLLARLHLSNEAGEMLTFNVVTKDWEPWY
jgi:hypothetical protein